MSIPTKIILCSGGCGEELGRPYWIKLATCHNCKAERKRKAAYKYAESYTQRRVRENKKLSTFKGEGAE